MKLPHHSPRSGFTLFELSMVLVIIGLVAGGVFVGKDLLRQSELRSVISDVEKFKTAIKAFNIKYSCLPGDCAKATKYFGTASGGCHAGGRSGTETCNGDGNGRINCGACDSGDGSLAGNVEPFLLWQHLANAELINGQYTGMTGPDSNYNAAVGTNVPASKVTPGGYLIGDMTHISGDANHFVGTKYTQVLFFGSVYPSNITVGPVLTPVEAMSVDGKADDGTPGTGKVVTFTSALFPNCVTSTDPATAKYNTSHSGVACPLFFNNIF